ncbi:predicted protein [Streptomyces viridosporus ATCC 14672]|uniref:Predicted protein n=1 Tax=Streptomyces viridosporus (strain ATCC 14672 / DSM 40746 / JCM 4963 / KCTC 9882 / NRRL B-12104 / FH 1290) TaxID=566461 RepID=D6A716_STRV1|nr:predicted protein [Streptomyces viridosporus ATCC 14672]
MIEEHGTREHAACQSRGRKKEAEINPYVRVWGS